MVDSILEIVESNSNDGRKVNDKLVSISAKWSNLRRRLEERKQNLDVLLRTSRQFYAYLGQLQDALQKISDNLEELAVENVYPEEVLKHLEDLQDQLEGQRPLIAGLELMRHITHEEALQLKEKLDSVQRRYTDLTGRADDLLKHAQETLPLVEQFHSSHIGLVNCLLDAEDRLQALDSSSAASGGSAWLDVQESIIARLENELAEVRPFLDTVNQSGPQLSQRCPGIIIK